MAFKWPDPTTTMPAPAQPPIMPPPPPILPGGAPPPLPPIPAADLPGLPGLPGIGLDILPTLGPPPLFKMTPPPTMPPPVTTPAPPTTPGPTTPAWVETNWGLIAGTTPNPWLQFTTTTVTTTQAPIPGIQVLTTLARAVEPGTKILMVASQEGLLVGRQIIIEKGTEREEYNKISAFGSIVCDSPLVFPHAPGANVSMMDIDLNATQYAHALAVAANRSSMLASIEKDASDQAAENLAAQRKAERERIKAEAKAAREAIEAKEEAAKEAKKAVFLQSDSKHEKGPFSFLYRSFNRLTHQQQVEGNCNCPCADVNTAVGVDGAFESIMSQNIGGTPMP